MANFRAPQPHGSPIMNSSPAPKVSRAHAFPLIWVVPLIAVAVGGWMTFRELYDRGPEITIDFADGAGAEANKTVLEYKGVSAGKVVAVAFKPGLDGVSLRLRLKKGAAELARGGTQFWIVHPEIGLSGVKGLDTLVTGGRLNVMPGLDGVSLRLRLKKGAAELARGGTQFWIVHPEIGLSGVKGLDTLVTGVRLNVMPGKGAPTKWFRGLDKTPPPDVTDQGRSFILHCDKLGSLTTGAPVFFRELKVGAVEASRLSEDSTEVLVRIHLEAPFVDLVRTNTRFWNTGGFSFKVSLFGAELKDTSLESLVTGGVAFA